MTTGRLFAGIALLLGLGAALSGSPFRAASPEKPVMALELAAWIRDRRPGLRVIDVRPVNEFDAYQIPTAEHFLPDAFDQLAPTPDEILVLYAHDVASANQAAARLRSAGHPHIFVLDGGVNAWIDDVMSPARSTDLTRYFGGVVRPAGANGVRSAPRRGC